MSDTVAGARGVANTIRTALGIGGAIALIVGILILVWPAKTAAVGTAIIAIYAIATGLVYVALAFFSKRFGAWARVGHVVLGLLFIAAGIVAFVNLADTTVFLAVFVAVFIGITWIIEGVVALTTLGDQPGRGWTIFFAVVSLLAGIMLLFSPLIAAAFLWLYVGFALVVLGIVQLVRALTWGKRA
jgi:uncharacterized membrane protein HdeD (DUF308 family)